jgi:hypothetical protein
MCKFDVQSSRYSVEILTSYLIAGRKYLGTFQGLSFEVAAPDLLNFRVQGSGALGLWGSGALGVLCTVPTGFFVCICDPLFPASNQSLPTHHITLTVEDYHHWKTTSQLRRSHNANMSDCVLA